MLDFRISYPSKAGFQKHVIAIENWISETHITSKTPGQERSSSLRSCQNPPVFSPRLSPHRKDNRAQRASEKTPKRKPTQNPGHIHSQWYAVAHSHPSLADHSHRPHSTYRPYHLSEPDHSHLPYSWSFQVLSLRSARPPRRISEQMYIIAAARRNRNSNR